ncbi:MAG: metal ABC transporter ATP-binding protein [Bacteroidetes bacterium]|nr:metal ABC transporter ATP-binding protein [Bacteroidota bacterium]
MNAQTLIHLEHATLAYGRNTVLRDITLSIHRGDYVGLVGPNGAGKTTLLRAILGTLPPRTGSRTAVRPDGTPLRFGYVPQRDSIESVLPYTASDVVMMGRYRQIGFLRFPGRKERAMVLDALRQVGMDALAGRVFRDLSGGQKQRVLIARALATDPDVLILDEPTNGMDLASRAAILGLIDALHEQEKLTILMVSHLMDDVVNHVERLAIVERDFFQIGDVEEILTGSQLSALYGVPVKVDHAGGHVVVTVGGSDEPR